MRKSCARIVFGADVALATSGIALAVMIGAASSAPAAVLYPGDTGPTAVTPSPLGILPSGDTLIPGAMQTNPFIGTTGAPSNIVKFTGTLTSAVYNDPTTGGLDFLYQITNDPTSVDEFDELSLSSFSSFSTDVDYVNGTGDVNPDSTTRSSGAGKIVAFMFSGGVPGGQDTSEMLVETNSHNFMVGVGSVIDGATGGTTISAPATGTFMSNVPEPASFSAILLAGGMLLGRRRR
jgi:hypothetical protein